MTLKNLAQRGSLLFLLIFLPLLALNLHLDRRELSAPTTAVPADSVGSCDSANGTCAATGAALNGFGNEAVGEAIASYLLSLEQFSWQTAAGSTRVCVVDNLAPETQLFPVYVWARCGEFAAGQELRELSGSSLPLKIDYPNELSFYDLRRFSFEAPRDGAAYEEDLARIFPAPVRTAIDTYDASNISRVLEIRARERIAGWEKMKAAIAGCQVRELFQAHSLAVSATLKDDSKLSAYEPAIDDIIDAAIAAQPQCGKIPMATE